MRNRGKGAKISALQFDILGESNPSLQAHRMGVKNQRATKRGPFITQVAAGRLPQLGVFGDDYPTRDGTGVRDYIHVVDLAKGHVKAIEYAGNHKGCEVFNLGTGTGYSVLDIVKAFEKVNGVKIPYVIKPRRAGDVAECFANADKAEKILGWKAEKNLDDMCYDSWNWQSHNINGYK